MSINASDLERRLQRLARAQKSNSTVKVSFVSGAKGVSASINHISSKIVFELPSDWDPAKYERIKSFVEKMRIEDSVKNSLDDITFHEIGHNRMKNDGKGLGCPVDLEGKEICVDAVTKEMISAGRFSPNGALYLENMISDIIDNLNCSRYSRFNGMAIFYGEQGEILKGKYSPLYEAFVKLNMQLWGTKKQKQLLKEYYQNSKEVDKVVADCIKQVGLEKDRDKNLQLLFDKSRWPEIFSKFAKNLVKLMDRSSLESLPGSGGKGYEVPAEFDKGGKFDPEKCDDHMMKRVLDTDNMRKVMQRRNEQGESAPCFVENWKALDYLYQAKAGEIMIKAETPRKGEKLPISPIGARAFDHDKDDFEDLLFGKILLDEHGKPCLAVPRSHVEISQKYKKTIRSYPELNIAVLDNSGSMAEGANSRGTGRTNIIPWGDNSKYHYAVLAYYGVEKAMHRMGVATRTRYNLITFAEHTLPTGEKTYDERSAIKQRILQPVFGGNTTIDIKVLAKQAKQPGSVLMTISDGHIYNWDAIESEFRRIISDKFYVHFQIGEESETTKALESWGAKVIRISDASEMPRQAIDITQKFYKSYSAGEI